MREEGFTFSKFVSGLRPRSNGPKNEDTLIECFGLIPKAEGLLAPPVIAESIMGISANHPWPQVFFGNSFWLCCTEYKIYTINADWTVTLAFDVTSYYGTYPNAPRGTWHFEDYTDFVILTNGGVTVLYNTETSQWEYNDGTTIPTLGSLCNFNGQLIGLGVETVTGDSKTIFQGTDSKSVMWSQIGHADFVITQSNQQGHRLLHGSQYKVMKLGEFVVSYGSKSINILKASGTTYGLVRAYSYGIASRDAVGGDDKNHVFIDAFGNFYHINSELKISGPNYKEFFSQMLGNEIVIQHSELDNEFYITDGVLSFMRTNEGCGQISKAYTGIDTVGANRIGIATDLADETAYFTTDIQNFGETGRKKVTICELDCNASDNVYIATAVRYNREDSWEDTPWVQINPGGFASINVEGVDFKIKVKCDDADDFDPDTLRVRVQFDDRRSVRGRTHANTTI